METAVVKEALDLAEKSVRQFQGVARDAK